MLLQAPEVLKRSPLWPWEILIGDSPGSDEYQRAYNKNTIFRDKEPWTQTGFFISFYPQVGGVEVENDLITAKIQKLWVPECPNMSSSFTMGILVLWRLFRCIDSNGVTPTVCVPSHG